MGFCFCTSRNVARIAFQCVRFLLQGLQQQSKSWRLLLGCHALALKKGLDNVSGNGERPELVMKRAIGVRRDARCVSSCSAKRFAPLRWAFAPAVNAFIAAFPSIAIQSPRT